MNERWDQVHFGKHRETATRHRNLGLRKGWAISKRERGACWVERGEQAGQSCIMGLESYSKSKITQEHLGPDEQFKLASETKEKWMKGVTQGNDIWMHILQRSSWNFGERLCRGASLIAGKYTQHKRSSVSVNRKSIFLSWLPGENEIKQNKHGNRLRGKWNIWLKNIMTWSCYLTEENE